jgi:two-component sensor histidine kinase
MPSTRSALSRWFWPAQIGGWLCYGLQQYLAGVGMLPRVDLQTHLFTLLDMSTGFASSLVLREVLRRSWHWPMGWRVLAGAVAVLVLSATYGVITVRACPNCRMPTSWMGYVFAFGQCLYLLLAWCGGYLGTKFAFAMQHEREQALRARAAAQQAQLRMLCYQLNPHFLFNALNTLSTRMVERNDAEGEQMIDALAGFLRYSLDADPEQDVSLREELDATQRYLAIEQARFDSRLRVSWDVDAEALRARVPGLVLQPLVENAIKHAVAPREEGGHIGIHARIEQDVLTIEIRDDGAGSDDYGTRGAGRGVGLGNVRERLQVRYGTRQRFEVARCEPAGTCARLTVPFEPVDRRIGAHAVGQVDTPPGEWVAVPAAAPACAGQG